MNEIAELREKVAVSTTTPQVKIAIELLLYTFVRPGELQGATWSEFDLEKGEWRIPRAHEDADAAHRAVGEAGDPFTARVAPTPTMPL